MDYMVPRLPSTKKVLLWGAAGLALVACLLHELVPVALCLLGPPYDTEVCEVNDDERAEQRSGRLKWAAMWAVLALGFGFAASRLG